MPRYSCFGLTIDAAGIDLPGLNTADDSCEADLAIRFGTIDSQQIDRAVRQSFHAAGPSNSVLYYPKAGAYQIIDGREIVIDRAVDSEPGAVRSYLVGPVMSVAAHQRGLLMLHASAVTMGSGAVVFMAMSGTGKSTMAAALTSRGHGVLADDVVAVTLPEQSQVSMLPGCQQLKLFDEAAAQLGPNCEKTAVELMPNFPKRGWRIPRQVSNGPVPILRIYELQDADGEDGVLTLSPSEAFSALVRNSYLLGILGATQTQALHFQQILRLAGGGVPVKVLKRRRSLAALPEVVRIVEEDIGQGCA